MSTFASHHPGRRALLQSAAVFCGLAGLPVAHAQMAVSTGFNRVARFRALSQRVAKASMPPCSASPMHAASKPWPLPANVCWR